MCCTNLLIVSCNMKIVGDRWSADSCSRFPACDVSSRVDLNESTADFCYRRPQIAKDNKTLIFFLWATFCQRSVSPSMDLSLVDIDSDARIPVPDCQCEHNRRLSPSVCDKSQTDRTRWSRFFPTRPAHRQFNSKSQFKATADKFWLCYDCLWTRLPPTELRQPETHFNCVTIQCEPGLVCYPLGYIFLARLRSPGRSPSGALPVDAMAVFNVMPQRQQAGNFGSGHQSTGIKATNLRRSTRHCYHSLVPSHSKASAVKALQIAY
jgi:hypothetical protein